MSPRHALVLLVGVIAVSWSAPLIRLADAPALVIAALRLAIAAPVMLGVAALTSPGELRRLALPDGAAMAIAGVALAAHFAAWVAAVQQTSIITGVVLVTMQPIFVALGAWLVLGERPTNAVLAGVAIAFAGALLLAGDDLGDAGSLRGDLLALLGSVFSSTYLIVGRGVRARLSTPSYTAVVYSLTAVVLLAALAVTQTPPTGQRAEAYVYILLIALVPQLIGHNAFNWALGSIPAAVVAVAILGEPVGATLIAAILLDEVPTLLEWIGAAVVLAGVYVALRRAPAQPAPTEDVLREPVDL